MPQRTTPAVTPDLFTGVKNEFPAGYLPELKAFSKIYNRAQSLGFRDYEREDFQQEYVCWTLTQPGNIDDFTKILESRMLSKCDPITGVKRPCWTVDYDGSATGENDDNAPALSDAIAAEPELTAEELIERDRQYALAEKRWRFEKMISPARLAKMMNVSTRRAQDLRHAIIQQLERDTCGGTAAIDLDKIEYYAPQVYSTPAKSAAGRPAKAQENPQRDFFAERAHKKQDGLFDGMDDEDDGEVQA